MPIEGILSGSASRLRQASQAAAVISSQVWKTRFDSQLLRKNSQTFSTGFSSGRAGRQEDRGDVGRDLELGGGMPSGAVEQQHGVGVRRCARSRRDGVASCRCRRRATPAPRRPRAPGRWRRTDRRCLGRLAGEAGFRAWPIAARGRSSGRCGLRPETGFRPASSPATR